MMEALGESIASADVDPNAFEQAFAFHTQLQALCAHNVDLAGPPDFAARARSAYVECVQDNAYYFFVDELLVMCAKAL